MTALLPKSRIVRDQAWLDHLKERRCIITGLHGTDYDAVDPAHIGTLGRGIKSSDDEVLPILHRYHVMQPQMGEMTMWRKFVPDDVLRAALRAYAREMYAEWKASPAGKRWRLEHGEGR